MFYTGIMFPNKHKISQLAIFIMLALVISSSFCLNFLAMAALAAGTAGPVASSQSVAGHQPMSSDNSQCQSMNQPNINNTPLISPLAATGVQDCCINNDHGAAAAISASGSFNQASIITPLFIAGENISDSFSDNCLIIYSPPPHLAALGTVKKNE